MNAAQTSLTHHPLLPFALARTSPPEAHRPGAAPLPFTRDQHPDSSWRNSLAVDADGLAGVETWIFLVFAGMVPTALAISQSVLWHLINHGVVNRVIHDFLLAPNF